MNIKLEVAELIEQAVDVLQTNGWGKNAYELNGRMCGLGACNYAATGNPADESTEELVWHLLDVVLHASVRRFGYDFFDDWQDEPERTFEEVRDLMLSIAADLHLEAENEA